MGLEANLGESFVIVTVVVVPLPFSFPPVDLHSPFTFSCFTFMVSCDDM